MGESEHQPTNTAQWDAFLSKLKVAGVEVRQSKSGYYLYRKVDGRELAEPLPMKFDPANPNALGAVGGFYVDRYCRRLEIDRSKYLKGWYDVF